MWPQLNLTEYLVWYISLQNFKKALRHFLTANRKKTFQRIFSYNSGCKRKIKKSFERFSCLEFIFEKSKHREAGLKHARRLRIFRDHVRDTWILVFVNENCCLCICFSYFSLVILIAVPFVFSRSVNIACRSTQNAARIKRFWRLHIDKTIK